MRKGIAALAVLFLAAHLPLLPRTLEDLDSVNFAMGVRDFDVAQHQPHPPGYPLFIALGKLGTSLGRASGVAAPEVRGLALWSALAGALLIPLTFALFRALDGDRRRSALAAVLTAACPLFWFTALRPLSDMVGLAAAYAAVGLLAAAVVPTEAPRSSEVRSRLLIAGACVAGFAIGFRSQTSILTLPFTAFAVLVPRPDLPARARAGALIALAAGIALWGIPLIMVTGGPSAYLAALRSQAGEDLSGVVMVWTHRGIRVAALALLHTFVLPWDCPILAGVMVALAGFGTLVLIRRSPRALILLMLLFGPYACFHLLFQETLTVRYGLPLVAPAAYLAANVLTEGRRLASAAVTIALVTFSLALALPASIAFGRNPSPIFALIDDMKATTSGNSAVIAMHRRVFSESRRARKWAGPLPGRLLAAHRDYEWLEPIRTWLEGYDGPIWFVADPRRTDLALIDSRQRRTVSYRWPFHSSVYMGGTRPDELDWHVYGSPNWFLERGWALTPEVAGITERDGWGPHRQPSVGWVRRRTDQTELVFGGRHLGADGDPPVRLIMSIDEHPVLTFDTGPGFFLRFASLPGGTLNGDGRYARLTVRAEPMAGPVTPRVAIEQFDLQPSDAVLFGFDEGWYEPEYNPRTARSWRWMSDRAVVRIRNAGRDVVMRIQGESPRRYYSSAPIVRISAGGQDLARFSPDEDFTRDVVVPSRLLADDGAVVLQSNLTFVPAEREGIGDRRRLALRIYSLSVRARL